MLFVTNSVQLVQRMPYQGNSGRVWRLQNRRENHSHCEICRRPCVTGQGRKGATGMTDKLIEIGRCYGMEMNVEKTKVMRISRQPFLIKIMIDQNQLENVECFKYLGSMLTNDGRCTCEIKCGIAMAKAAFNKKRALFTSTLDLELREKLVKCYIWKMALYGAETWTLRAVD